MKKEPGAGWLAGLHALLVVGVFVELTLYMRNSRTGSYQQAVALELQHNSVAFQSILAETMQYAQKNPGIEPVLASIGVVRNPPAPGPTVNPNRR